jgi:hypothetical protein
LPQFGPLVLGKWLFFAPSFLQATSPTLSLRLQHHFNITSYFKSKFHVVDSLVVVGGFILDLSLHGAIEEAASLIVVLRLWRVFKIIEELSVGAQEQVNDMDAEIVRLEAENLALKRKGESLKTEITALKADLAALKEQGEKIDPAKD